MPLFYKVQAEQFSSLVCILKAKGAAVSESHLVFSRLWNQVCKVVIVKEIFPAEGPYRLAPSRWRMFHMNYIYTCKYETALLESPLWMAELCSGFQLFRAFSIGGQNSCMCNVVSEQQKTRQISQKQSTRTAERLGKLKLQNGEIIKEEKQPASTQSTPSSNPYSSLKQKPRGWFISSSSTALPGSNPSIMDSGSGDKNRNSSEKWHLFGNRSFQKSDSGGFATQAYRGAQKPSSVELIQVQVTSMAEDQAVFKLPKMDMPVMEGKKLSAWTHKLKHHDLNELTPTGL
ncbi:putative monooxygenase p33MONOX [Choloepus didactylus]|uniref:putative monooxygenase p33MONOX n=1 Tax=Choloepus didactylus TaxID=27675 RepID=UPI00189E528B|nr:putative monooxygenase p33MONOX [Choloepus didactylus]